MTAITAVVPEKIEDIFKIEKPYQVDAYDLHQITTGITNFETILTNDVKSLEIKSSRFSGIFTKLNCWIFLS